MSVSFQDYISQVKSQVSEVTVNQLKDELEGGTAALVLDVREKHEQENGVIEGAKLVPRGVLEPSIENLVPDRSTEIYIYCAGGVRSAMAAKSLQDLGYQNVHSVEGGFGAWARAGMPVHVQQFLTMDQMDRYSRHLILPEVGEPGQLKLMNSKVLMIGAGGLGSPSAYYLAAAGVGTLGIIDADVVDKSNLQRQILHSEEWVGKPKVDSAKATLQALNGDIEIKTYNTFITSENVMEIIEGYDIVVDGCDNFPTRYLVNDACAMKGIPNVHGSIFRFDGQATIFMPGDEGPCYRCLYPEPPPPGMAPSCQEAGVLGVLPGVVGVIQAIETIKVLLGAGDPLIGRLLTFDALRMSFREMRIRQDPECPMCGENPTITELIDYEQFCSL